LRKVRASHVNKRQQAVARVARQGNRSVVTLNLNQTRFKKALCALRKLTGYARLCAKTALSICIGETDAKFSRSKTAKPAT
jgi:hypothetical protein